MRKKDPTKELLKKTIEYKILSAIIFGYYLTNPEMIKHRKYGPELSLAKMKLLHENLLKAIDKLDYLMLIMGKEIANYILAPESSWFLNKKPEESKKRVLYESDFFQKAYKHAEPYIKAIGLKTVSYPLTDAVKRLTLCSFLYKHLAEIEAVLRDNYKSYASHPDKKIIEPRNVAVKTNAKKSILLSIIKNAGDQGINGREILRLFHITASYRDEIITELIDMGLVIKKKFGQRSKYYFNINNKLCL